MATVEAHSIGGTLLCPDSEAKIGENFVNGIGCKQCALKTFCQEREAEKAKEPGTGQDKACPLLC